MKSMRDENFARICTMANNLLRHSTLEKWKSEFKWLDIRDNRLYCRIC